LPVTLEIIMDYSEQREQHREDTKYLQWSDGMCVKTDALKCDYELALVEDSLRRSVYFKGANYFRVAMSIEDQIGVLRGFAGSWFTEAKDIKLTRAQALYIATGDVNI
jgi:hypothetical protein